MVLGVAQDAGFPQAGCTKACCAQVWEDPSKGRMVSSLGVVDLESRDHWIFDATPDFPRQMKLLEDKFHSELKGVWLTHAHIGHYTGLMHLGHEVMGASSMPVFAMSRMQNYLRNNGPWSQLVTMNNISRMIKAWRLTRDFKSPPYRYLIETSLVKLWVIVFQGLTAKLCLFPI